MAPVGCQVWLLDKCDSYLDVMAHGPARIWCHALDTSCWPTQGEQSVTAVSCQVKGTEGFRYVQPWECCHPDDSRCLRWGSTVERQGEAGVYHWADHFWWLWAMLGPQHRLTWHCEHWLNCHQVELAMHSPVWCAKRPCLLGHKAGKHDSKCRRAAGCCQVLSWGGGICRTAATFAGSGLTPPAVMMWPMNESCVFFSMAFLALSLMCFALQIDVLWY